MNKIELEQRIREGIPLTTEMDFHVLALTDNQINVAGGGKQNRNVHGTAFAGSQYAIATLAAWGLVQSRLPDDADLVMARGEIDYRKPVVGDIVADCTIDKDHFDEFLTTLQHKGKARLNAISTITNNDCICSEFRGVLYARLNRESRGLD
jgi:thioesterase domain-containing protein